MPGTIWMPLVPSQAQAKHIPARWELNRQVSHLTEETAPLSLWPLVSLPSQPVSVLLVLQGRLRVAPRGTRVLRAHHLGSG